MVHCCGLPLAAARDRLSLQQPADIACGKIEVGIGLEQGQQRLLSCCLAGRGFERGCEGGRRRRTRRRCGRRCTCAGQVLKQQADIGLRREKLGERRYDVGTCRAAVGQRNRRKPAQQRKGIAAAVLLQGGEHALVIAGGDIGGERLEGRLRHVGLIVSLRCCGARGERGECGIERFVALRRHDARGDRCPHGRPNRVGSLAMRRRTAATGSALPG